MAHVAPNRFGAAPAAPPRHAGRERASIIDRRGSEARAATINSLRGGPAPTAANSGWGEGKRGQFARSGSHGSLLASYKKTKIRTKATVLRGGTQKRIAMRRRTLNPAASSLLSSRGRLRDFGFVAGGAKDADSVLAEPLAPNEALIDHLVAEYEEEQRTREGMRRCSLFADSPVRRLWERSLFYLLVVVYLVRPIDIAYNRHLGPEVAWTISPTFDVVLTVTYVVDVAMQLLTVIEDDGDGRLVYSLKGIASRYARRGTLVTDVLSCVPYALVATLSDTTFGIVFFSMLFKVPRFIRMLYARVHLLVEHQAEMRLLNVIVLFLLFAHWISCIWYAAGSVRYQEAWEEEETWVYTHNLQDRPLYSRYIRSLYYTIATMTSLPFSTIQPVSAPRAERRVPRGRAPSRAARPARPRLPPQRTDLEHTMTVCMQMIGNALTAYLFGSVIAYIKKLDERADLTERRMSSLRLYGQVHNVPAPVRQTLYDYSQAILDTGLNERHVLEQTLDLMPPGVRADVVLKMRRHLVEAVPMFASTSSGFVREVVQKLKPVLCLSGSAVYRSLERAEEMFFIQWGAVVLLSRNERRVYVTLESGSFFGELAMVSTCRRTNTAKAISDCHLFALHNQRFAQIMRAYPSDFDAVLRGARLELANIISSQFETDEEVRRELTRAADAFEQMSQHASPRAPSRFETSPAAPAAAAGAKPPAIVCTREDSDQSSAPGSFATDRRRGHGPAHEPAAHDGASPSSEADTHSPPPMPPAGRRPSGGSGGTIRFSADTMHRAAAAQLDDGARSFARDLASVPERRLSELREDGGAADDGSHMGGDLPAPEGLSGGDDFADDSAVVSTISG